MKYNDWPHAWNQGKLLGLLQMVPHLVQAAHMLNNAHEFTALPMSRAVSTKFHRRRITNGL